MWFYAVAEIEGITHTNPLRTLVSEMRERITSDCNDTKIDHTCCNKACVRECVFEMVDRVQKVEELQYETVN